MKCNEIEIMNRKIPAKKENEIIELFHSLKNNSGEIIANIANVSHATVARVMNDFFKTKTKYTKDFTIFESKMNYAYETSRKT